MVEISFVRDGDGLPEAVVARGHAAWAEHGEDLVCAAVSAILQAAWIGIDEVAGVAVEARRESGDLRLTWPLAARETVALGTIFSTAERALVHLARQYAAHMKVESIAPSR